VPVLARKLKRARWGTPTTGIAAGAIPADAITQDLKTESNQLSFWEFDDTSIAFKEAALAFVAGFDKLTGAIDIALIDSSDLAATGVTLSASPGGTPVADLTLKHRDCSPLDATRLVAIAKVILRSTSSDDRIHTFTLRELRNLLADAIATRRVRREALRPDLLSDVERFLNRSQS
jgi:hypothetical protein